ncbi:3'-5' exonuclease [Jeotgalibacillus sp. R-1-5s-1]|uniref:HelD family protein n=1 Tax=Jeotgalibacillus sp. R-1-5s-1 TaxID=2555897 RepID=UPI00141AB61B|nr:3'-5' exonuclease [Jeotgalibacillus sp. R-1-5s-1]
MIKEEFNQAVERLDETYRGLDSREIFIREFVQQKMNQFKNKEDLPGDRISYQSGKKEIHNLTKAMKKPYFGSVRLTHDDETTETEYYFGKHGIINHDEDIVVVDWRMPIAKIFYNYFSESPDQTYKISEDRRAEKVFVHSKSEYEIKNKKLVHMKSEYTDGKKPFEQFGEKADVEFQDLFLKRLFEDQTSSGYIKEIIATIQKEQYEAIRLPISENLIVQGVAGSGKSSVALHRLSHLMYNNPALPAEKFLVIGPSALFIKSAVDLLPELQIQHVPQKTFAYLINEFLSALRKEYNWPAKMTEAPIEKLWHNGVSVMDTFKNSKTFTKMLEEYINCEALLYEQLLSTPIDIAGQKISPDEIRRLYDEFLFLDFPQRTEKFIQRLISYGRDMIDIEIKKHEGMIYNFKKTFISGNKMTKLRESALLKDIDHLLELKKSTFAEEFERFKKQVKNQLQTQNSVNFYQSFLQSKNLLEEASIIDKSLPTDLVDSVKKPLDYYDLVCILFIEQKRTLYKTKYTHIIVDEAQDLSYMHLSILNLMSQSITLLGDTRQHLIENYGFSDWNDLNEIFGQQIKKLEFKTSYRSTQEIIKVSNKIFENVKIKEDNVVPVTYLGVPVQYYQTLHSSDFANICKEKLDDWVTKKYRIAIIHNSEGKAQKLAGYLKDELSFPIEYINQQSESFPQVSVLSALNCKGMEFDAVLLANVDEQTYPSGKRNAKLLYIMATRAQKELCICYYQKPSELLNGLIEKRKLAKNVDIF